MRPPYYTQGLWGRLQFHPLGVAVFGLGLSFVMQAMGAALGLALVGALWPDVDLVALMGGGQVTADGATAVKVYQMLTQFGWFLAPALLLTWADGAPRQSLSLERTPGVALTLLAIVTMLAGLPALQATMLSPEALAHLPEPLQEIQQWAVDQEKRIHELLLIMLKHNLALNLLVVAVVPAVCEELFFRGFLLSTFRRVMGPGWAVWITAFLFSLLHFQFLGFVPRLLLGVFFGYLVVWSQSLWPAVLAHFVNNAVNVVVAYLALNGSADEALLDSDLELPVAITLASLAVTTGLVWALYRKRLPLTKPKLPLAEPAQDA